MVIDEAKLRVWIECVCSHCVMLSGCIQFVCKVFDMHWMEGRIEC